MKTENWQLKMDQQRNLKRKGAELLFDRIKLLVECEDDADFQSHCADEGIPVFDYLDRELDDTATNYLTLKAVFFEHPRKADWSKGGLRRLIAQTQVSQKREKRRDCDNRFSWKQRCLAAEKENERLRLEIDSLKVQIANLKESLSIVSRGQHMPV